jgi:hypothetical protein
MRKTAILPIISILFIGLGWLNVAPAFGQMAPAGGPKIDRDKILYLRPGKNVYSREEIDFMVKVVFADAMNSDRWANQWIRKYHIPSVTHLSVRPSREGENSPIFTVLRLPEQESFRIVVIKGFQGNPNVRRWMTSEGLLIYFRKLTTNSGGVREFKSGFLGMRVVRLGLDLKNVLDDLHSRGLMGTRKEPPLSESEKRENSDLRLAVSEKVS